MTRCQSLHGALKHCQGVRRTNNTTGSLYRGGAPSYGPQQPDEMCHRQGSVQSMSLTASHTSMLTSISRGILIGSQVPSRVPNLAMRKPASMVRDVSACLREHLVAMPLARFVASWSKATSPKTASMGRCFSQLVRILPKGMGSLLERIHHQKTWNILLMMMLVTQSLWLMCCLGLRSLSRKRQRADCLQAITAALQTRPLALTRSSFSTRRRHYREH
mmetsp:Transcript_118045/g.229518  ORF Transcript_118045/g.229518 Transcript_118045/m.229518 type:complete len:218 (-) Transcript_118045:239-892(-)